MKREKYSPLIIHPKEADQSPPPWVVWFCAFALVVIFGGGLFILVGVIRAIAHYWGA